MEFTDERIQQMKREARQKQVLDFTQPVLIGEEEYNFTRTMFYEDKVSILFPIEFVDMPEEMTKLKYPMEQRPQIIKTNLALSVNFAFNLFPQQFTEDQTSEAVKSFKSLIKRMQPVNCIFAEKVEKTDDMTIGWFDFKSPGIDEPLYTMMAFSSIDSMLFHCIFNAAHRRIEDWKPVALQVFRSIQDETRKKATVR